MEERDENDYSDPIRSLLDLWLVLSILVPLLFALILLVGRAVHLAAQ